MLAATLFSAGWADSDYQPAPPPESIAMAGHPAYPVTPGLATADTVSVRLPMLENSLCMEPVSHFSDTESVATDAPYHWLCSNTAEVPSHLRMASNSPDDYTRYHLLRIQKSRSSQEVNPWDSSSDMAADVSRDGSPKTFVGKLLSLAKGKPAPDGLYGGLWSYHYNTDNKYHTTGNLVAFQRNGIFYGTFANSHAQQTFLVGWARTVFQKQLSKSWAVSGGYKFGPMYGYRYDGVPNFHGFTVMPLLTLGVNYKRFGVDFNTPAGSNSLSMNFHLNWLPAFMRKKADVPL
jgi:hypothetical protein